VESVSEKRTAVNMFPLIDEYRAGNLTQKQFCQRHNLPLWTFHYWLRKYRKQPIASATPAAFVPVRIAKTAGPVQPNCEIVYPNGVTLRFHHPVEPDLLSQLIHAGS